MVDKTKNTTDSIQEEIQQAADKLNIDIKWARGISPEDLLYLLDQCPFLQILDTAPEIKSEPDPVKFIKSESGWTIHNYGDAMSSSPGKLLFGGYYQRVNQDEDDEGGGGFAQGSGEYIQGKGTIRGQAYVTAAEMIDQAKALGWSGIKIVDGHPWMMRRAWLQANKQGLPVEGFAPTEHDKLIQKIDSLTANELESRLLASRETNLSSQAR
jgi:hypothetical protein